MRAVLVALLLAVGCFGGTMTAEAEALPVTSPFGWRVHPQSGDWRFHAGVDLGYDYGTGISALFDGVVVQADDFGDGYGLQVLLYHEGADSFTRYGHCSAVFCQVGDFIPAGEVIGTVGSTGNSTGPHLHLEYIIPTDSGYQYADPLDLFQ